MSHRRPAAGGSRLDHTTLAGGGHYRVMRLTKPGAHGAQTILAEGDESALTPAPGRLLDLPRWGLW